MIGNYAESYIALAVCILVFESADFFCFVNRAAKHICIVITLLTLNHTCQTLKAHTRIHVLCRQLFQAAIFQSVKLDEYIVPDFNYLRMVIVHQCFAIYSCALFVGATIHMNFCTWSAWSGIAHFPEIIFLIA